MLHAFYRWLWYRLHGQICVITSLGLVSRHKVWVVKVMNILRPQSPCKHSFEGDAFSFFVILVCPLALISVFQRIYIKQFFILFAVIIRFEHSKNVSRSKKYHPLNIVLYSQFRNAILPEKFKEYLRRRKKKTHRLCTAMASMAMVPMMNITNKYAFYQQK